MASAGKRVLIADKLAPLVEARLSASGRSQIRVDAKLSEDALVTAMKEFKPHVLIVRSTKVKKQHITATSELSLIIRAGAGVNTIDLLTASELGVYVANCPGKNACAVAELAMGHLINLDRRISDNVAALRSGTWNKSEFGKAPGLRTRTLALIGFGMIAQEVCKRAQAFGMEIVAWSRSLRIDSAPPGVAVANSIEDAVARADAVSVHLALAPETKGIIGASVFAAMKDQAYFINTSRGEVVDQPALLDAIKSKGIRAGLDVFASEPKASKDTFGDADVAGNASIYGTHHIGASTDEAETAVGSEVLRILSAFFKGRPVPNCVNLEQDGVATHCISIRHVDTIGVLADVLEAIRQHGLNVQNMQNTVFKGGKAALASIFVSDPPSAECLKELMSRKNVHAVDVAMADEVSLPSTPRISVRPMV